jgi:selenocysteine lyase/cysteine desulfurase
MEKRLRTLREGGTGSSSELDVQPDVLPDKYEPGSHNAIGLAGLSEGVQWVLEKTVAKLTEHERSLIDAFLDGLAETAGLTCYGPPAVRSRVGVMSVRIDAIEPQELAAVLESSFGILTRAGLHCAPFAHEAIGTLALGGTTRFSFGPFVDVADVQYAAGALAQIAQSQNARGADQQSTSISRG